MAQPDRTAELKELLHRRILIIDGAMGTMIQRYGLDEKGFRGPRFADHPRDLRGNNELLNLTRTAQQVNETNGTLINARLRGTQQALNALLSAAQIPGTYTADGSTVSSRRRQSLGVA